MEWSLPPPLSVSADEAAVVARDLFGITGTARSLGSNQDTNLAMTTDGGSQYVLKVANPGTSAEDLDLQNAVMAYLADIPLGVLTPTALEAVDGRTVVSVDFGGGKGLTRMLTYLDGALFSQVAYTSPAALQRLGEVAARICSALAEFDHPAADRVHQYDPRRGAEVVAALAAGLAEGQRTDRLLALNAKAWARIEPAAAQLRCQVIHGDLADYNVVAAADAAGRWMPSGVIDFGDVARSWLVGELAIAVASLLAREPRTQLSDLVQVVRGFHRVTPLSEAEVSALWPLVASRACVLAASVEQLSNTDPNNAYVAEERDLDWRILNRVADTRFDVAEAAFRHGLGFEVHRVGAPGWNPSQLVVGYPASAPSVDLSVTSPLVTGAPWDGADAAGIAHTLSDGFGLAGPGARVLRSRTDRAEEHPTVQLGSDVFAPVGTPVVTPEAGVVVSADESSVTVRCASYDLCLEGLSADVTRGQSLAAGQLVGRVGASEPHPSLPSHLHVRCVPTGADPGRYVVESVAEAWASLVPTAQLSTGFDPEELIRRRAASVAAVQEHYFERPPQIERGWGQHLIDTSGRAYLDVVNNVAVLGHSHPAVTEAAARQFGLLNTNSRFSYEAMVTYAERITALLPVELDTVFFVNSGSEAVDLALRIARTATARRDTICLAGAYHGWTTATDEISTSLNDNPNSRGTRPGWIHLATMPNLYRGEHRGLDAGERYADAVRTILDRLTTGPAAFIAEPLSGNAGGVELPPGYLSAVYHDVRAHGGLVISDEVQVGYGRTGSHFWGFEAHGVVPDLVTMAKAAGNGHPVGFVVTRREIAEAFRSQGSFFSSAGGGGVSAKVGLAVLDILQAEDLQGNAARVGAYLRGRLDHLATRHPMIGHVHGRGLYLGVELVSDPGERTPATAAAAAICERLLRRGVIDHATGDHSNVLKVKPPLCVTESSADFFVDQLDEVLSTGW